MAEQRRRRFGNIGMRFFSVSASKLDPQLVSVAAEPTPNPETIKFTIDGISHREIVSRGCVELDRHGGIASASTIHLADEAEHIQEALMADSRVLAITLGPDFISVRKRAVFDWDDDFCNSIAETIRSWTATEWSGEPVDECDKDDADDQAEDQSAQDVDEETADIIDHIQMLLDTRIRPTLHADGGDVQYKGFDKSTGVVQLQLYGACTSCPSSTVTMRFGIKNLLKHYIPEVTDVVPFDSDDDGDDRIEKYYGEDGMMR